MRSTPRFGRPSLGLAAGWSSATRRRHARARPHRLSEPLRFASDVFASSIPLLALAALACGSTSERAQPLTPSNDPCPVLSNPENRASGGLVPSLVGEDVATELDALAASLPAVAEGTRVAKIPRGQAGHWSPEVATTYEREGVTWRVSITDLVHVCTCAPGMGELLAREVANAEERALGSAPARVRPGEVLAWIHDRCVVEVRGSGSSEAAWNLAREIDLEALARACPAR